MGGTNEISNAYTVQPILNVTQAKEASTGHYTVSLPAFTSSCAGVASYTSLLHTCVTIQTLMVHTER